MYDCAPQKFTTKNPPTIRCDITNTSLSDPNYISTIHPILTALIAEEDTLRKEQRRQGRVHNVPHKKHNLKSIKNIVFIKIKGFNSLLSDKIIILKCYHNNRLYNFKSYLKSNNEIVSIFINIFSAVLTVAGILVPMYQWKQDTKSSNAEYQQEIQRWREEDKRWQQEGARFKLSYVTAPEEKVKDTNLSDRSISSRASLAMVITNTGRTQGTVIEIRQEKSTAHETMCITSTNSNGVLDLKSKPLALPNTNGHIYQYNSGNQKQDSSSKQKQDSSFGETQITLQPGESQLIFLAGSSFQTSDPMPDSHHVKYTLYTTDGREDTVQPSTESEIFTSHYKNLPGFTLVRDQCNWLAQQEERKN